jgi:hypothetical protein
MLRQEKFNILGKKHNDSRNENRTDSEGSVEASRELKKPGPQKGSISLSSVSIAEIPLFLIPIEPETTRECHDG